MATSRSGRPHGKWRAGASLFSGRPDPLWAVGASTSDALLDIWSKLKPFRGALPKPPGLGYRGCFLIGPDESRWEAYAGVVSLRGDVRTDQDRSFERRLLDSAPRDAGVSSKLLEP